MKQPVRLFVGALLAVFTFFGVSGITLAQDKGKDAKAAPAAKAPPPVAGETRVLDGGATQKTLVRNDKVIVFEVTWKPGQGGNKANKPPARVVRALQGGTLLRTYEDGTTEKFEWKTGDVRFFEAETKAGQLTNVGKTDVVLYNVFLRGLRK